MDVPVVLVPADLYDRMERDHRAMETLRAMERVWTIFGASLHGVPPNPDIRMLGVVTDPADAILGPPEETRG